MLGLANPNPNPYPNPKQFVRVYSGAQLLHLQPAVPEVQRLHSLQPELNSLQVMTWTAAPVRDKQPHVERVAALLQEVTSRLDGAIRQLDPRAQGFNARTDYQPAQLDALRGARDSELASRQGQGTPGILGVLSEVLHVRCDDPTHARTLAALLSDVAGNRHANANPNPNPNPNPNRNPTLTLTLTLGTCARSWCTQGARIII